MQIKNSLIAFVLGLGLTLALVLALSTVEGSLLGGGRLPVARAASFTVTKKSDGNDGACDADCSLREAIVVANSNGEADIITLGLGRFGLTITGTGENAAATGDLDVTGPLTITGRGPGQTIIDASGVISDRVFDIRPGAGTVVISGVTIMNGNVTGLGGGIYNYNADLTLVNVEVRNNVVTGTSSHGRGGGIYIDQGSLSLDGVQIVSNTANTFGGGVYFNQGSGTLSGGQIISNTAGGPGGGVAVLKAAAAFTQTGDSMVAYNAASSGGGVYIYQGSATLLEGQIFSNTTRLYGGGVDVYQAGASFAMSGGQIISNTAGDRGGGVFIYLGSSAALSGGRIAGNTAPDGGGVYVSSSGAVFTQTGGVLTHNTADDGGGVYVATGSATLSGGQVTGNTATRGGGVYVRAGSATLNGGQITGNTATFGGGVYVSQSDATLGLSGSQILGNTADDDGGGLYIVSGGATLRGGQVISNTAASDGGGMYNNNGTLTLVNTTLSGNRATAGGGGGLWNNNGTSVLTYTTVASNTASTAGGGIHRAGGMVLLQDSIVAYNSADNCNTALTSNGHNLEDANTCGFSATGDWQNADPLLGPLTGSGGTLVHPLLDGSPAIDEGLCLPGVTTVDQRGVTRPQGDGCDIGAYEVALVAPTGVIVDGPTDGVVGESYTFEATPSPPTATPPFTYTWSPMPDGGQSTDVATYSWTTPGTKTITVTVENAAGGAIGTRDIVIADYKVYLPLVLKN